VAESNWSERLPYEVEKWRENVDLLRVAEAVHAILRETGRV
jgi:hypothetical protein